LHQKISDLAYNKRCDFFRNGEIHLSILEQKAFIANIPPFDRLSNNELDNVAQALDIEYYKSGQCLIERGDIPNYLYIVIKGIIEERSADGEITLHENQDSFGAIGILNSSCQAEFVVREEALCYLLPKDIFITIGKNNPRFENYYYQTLSQRLNRMLEQRDAKELASFMVARIYDAYIRPPFFVDHRDSIYNAVASLQKYKITSILVRRDEEVGIVTDTDIRNHVILKRKSVDDPVGEIATFPAIFMQYDDYLFNALLLMTKRSIKRVAIKDEENIIGVLDQMDLLSYFSHHSHLVSVQIDRSANTEQLKKASESIFKVIQTLNAKGVKTHAITQLVNELNLKVYNKLFHLIAPKEVIENTCLLVMGSEGRGEQILKTDQDNALIIRDGFEHPELSNILQEFVNCLVDFGYPLCEGNVMVTNPEWTKSLSDFKNMIYNWINSPQEYALMPLTIFYDATTASGDSKLLEETKEHLFNLLFENGGYFTRLARPVLSFETPLSWFANFILDKSHKGGLDIKKGGLFPIVHGVRTLALEYRLPQTNTVDRIDALSKNGVFDAEFAEELREAFACMLNLRLEEELMQYRAGKPYDNYIQPNRLNKLERDLLRDSLKIVNKFKTFISYHFKLNMVT
jgi:CBS domain-containing protein